MLPCSCVVRGEVTHFEERDNDVAKCHKTLIFCKSR